MSQNPVTNIYESPAQVTQLPVLQEDTLLFDFTQNATILNAMVQQHWETGNTKSELSINCSAHKLLAVFFSNQQQKYKCFKCLLEEQDLIYIDIKFKKEMEEYERIKNLAADIIKEKSSNMNLMKSWKSEIRKVLMQVREQFLSWIEIFTNQFVQSLKDIENSKDLKQFRGEDRRLNQQLESLRDKYMQIMRIFTLISNSKADQKVEVIEKYRSQMNAIENEVLKQNNYMQQQLSKMSETQKRTVSIDGLKQKIEVKYFQFFDKKLKMMRSQGSHNDTLGVSMMMQNQSVQQSMNQYNTYQQQQQQPTQQNNRLQQMQNNNQSLQMNFQHRTQSDLINNLVIEQSSRDFNPNQDQVPENRYQTPPYQQIQSNNGHFHRPSIDTLDLSDIKGLPESRKFADQSSFFPDFLDFMHENQAPVQNNFNHYKIIEPKLETIEEVSYRKSVKLEQQKSLPQVVEQKQLKTIIPKNNSHQDLTKLEKKDSLQDNDTNSVKNSNRSPENHLGQHLQPPTTDQGVMRLTKEVLNKLDSDSNSKVRSSIQKIEEMIKSNQGSSFSISNHNSMLEASTISRYRHKNQNSIYFLRPNSKEIYLLDFKLQGFVKEQLYTQIPLPTYFSSAQLQSGNIYVIGGVYLNHKQNTSCLEIDANMNVLEKEPLPSGARCNIGLALIIDKFILAIGGDQLSNSQSTNVCEIFDTLNNQWYPAPSLNKPRSSTSACVVNHRYVYTFPGSSQSSHQSIEMLDLGTIIEPNEIKSSKWQFFKLYNKGMANSYGFGSIQLSQNEILLFGGGQGQTFSFDFQSVFKKPSTLSLSQSHDVQINHLKKSMMCIDSTIMCHNSDFIARIYGNYLYAIDGLGGNLHVFSIKEKQWNYSTLKELGIN